LPKPTLSKLLKLKKWLTIPEAAKQLTGVCGEEVTENDILRFALDGHLRLSVVLVNSIPARVGHMVVVNEQDYDLAIENGTLPNKLGDDMMLHWEADKKIIFIQFFKDEYMPISGIWDISMVFGGSLLIEREYQKFSGCPTFELTWKIEDLGVGVVLVGDDGNTVCQLQNRCNSPESNISISYSPVTAFPEGSMLIVRIEAFREFERVIADDVSEGNTSAFTTSNKLGLSEIERNNLLKQIGGLALVLAEKNNRYKKGETPSANAIAESIIEIIGSLPDANQHGLGKSSIRDSIGNGLKLITK